MSYCIPIHGGFISMCDIEFDCPACTYHHIGKDYEEKLNNSKNGLIYQKCKGCKNILGITTDYKNDVHAWLKKEEGK